MRENNLYLTLSLSITNRRETISTILNSMILMKMCMNSKQKNMLENKNHGIIL